LLAQSKKTTFALVATCLVWLVIAVRVSNYNQLATIQAIKLDRSSYLES
jgi:hypothetical protein